MRGLILLTLLLSSCGWFGSHPAKFAGMSELTAPLQERVAVYQEQAPRDWDAYQTCDALLFASLLQVGLGEPGRIEDAQGAPGQWFRLPDASHCSSDISRDMFMGLFVYIWEFKRLDLAEKIWAYG